MTGREMEALHDALCDAFDYDSFRKMLRFRLDKPLEHLSAQDKFPVVVLNVIEQAIREGWVADLVRHAREYNPGNPKLRQFVEDHPGVLVATAPSSIVLPGDRPRQSQPSPARHSPSTPILSTYQFRVLKAVVHARGNRISVELLAKEFGQRFEDMVGVVNFLLTLGLVRQVQTENGSRVTATIEGASVVASGEPLTMM